MNMMTTLAVEVLIFALFIIAMTIKYPRDNGPGTFAVFMMGVVYTFADALVVFTG